MCVIGMVLVTQKSYLHGNFKNFFGRDMKFALSLIFPKKFEIFRKRVYIYFGAVIHIDKYFYEISCALNHVVQIFSKRNTITLLDMDKAQKRCFFV